MGGRRGERRRAVAIAASLALHAVLFSVLAWRLAGPPPVAEAPVMQVTLAPWPVRREMRAPNEKPSQRRTPIVPHVTTATAPVAAPPPVAIPPAPGPPAESGQKVLRGLLACRNADLLRLSREERQTCQERAGALAANAPEPKLKLDKGFVADRDQEDILIKKPVDGCRVRAAGVGCAWRF
jgi:hypothetical protein